MKLEDARVVILFGGSFDPPHRAHLELPEAARQAIGADLVAYVPAAQAPHKLDRVQSPATHRLQMLKLAVAGQAHATILTDELDRKGPSYTADTLRALRDRLPASVTLRLLIGADQVRIFDQWREPDVITRMAEPLVMLRPPETRETLLASLPPADREAWSARLVEVPQLDISSTQIRDRVKARKSLDGLMPEPVARYIAEHGLYR